MNGYRPFRSDFQNTINGMFPPAIQWLLLINAALFLIPRIIPINIDLFDRIFGLVPAYIWTKFYLWQLATYLFLHGGFWHIFMNMLILWMFGAELERTWGSREFVKFYFVAGIGAGIVNVIFAAIMPAMSYTPIIGASGAIYGVLVAYAMLFPDRYVLLYFLIPIKVKYMVIGLVAIEFALSYNADGVAHFAHLGGALVGFLYLKSDMKWRIKRWSPIDYFKRVKAEAMAKKRSEGMKIMDEVDAILDKINQVGYDNLTRREKKILEKASDNLSKQDRK